MLDQESGRTRRAFLDQIPGREKEPGKLPDSFKIHLLKTVVKSLTDNFRSSDIYRIGGDEFIVICPNIDKELFNEKMVNSELAMAETKYSATYGTIYATSSNNLEEMVEEASIRMKESKEKHRIEHPEQYDDKYKVKYIRR